MTYDWVLNAVKERSRRLSGRVELLQFHWHDYGAKDYLEILRLLVKITEVHPELVSAIGLCNFDSEHVEEICTYLLSKDGKVGIVSNQVQVSHTQTLGNLQIDVWPVLIVRLAPAPAYD